MTTANHDRQPIPTTPPPGWQFETPKYRVMREIQPAPKPRFRLEPPFTSVSDSDMWQYATRPLAAHEVVETREWPHPSFFPLNYSAKRTLEFFKRRHQIENGAQPMAGRSVAAGQWFFGQWHHRGGCQDATTGTDEPEAGCVAGIHDRTGHQLHRSDRSHPGAGG